MPVLDSSRPESDAGASVADGGTASEAEPASDQRLAAIDAELQPEAAAHVKVQVAVSQNCCLSLPLAYSLQKMSLVRLIASESNAYLMSSGCTSTVLPESHRCRSVTRTSIIGTITTGASAAGIVWRHAGRPNDAQAVRHVLAGQVRNALNV